MFTELSNQEGDDEEVFDYSNRTDAVLDRVHCFTSKVPCILQSLDVTKFMDPENVPSIVLKTWSAVLAGPLLSLFSGTFLRIWKSAYVIPMHVPEGVSMSVVSYRPISLLSCIGGRQYGFRPKRSTLDC